MSSRRKRTLSAALLLPVVLFSLVWTSFALWRCQSDGIARASCCCPQDKADQGSAPTTATVAPADCCAIERHQLLRAPAEPARTSAPQVEAPLAAVVAAIPVVVLPVFDPPALPPVTAWKQADGPPPLRSLLAQKQALLV